MRPTAHASKGWKSLVDYVRQAEAIDYAYKAYNLDGPTALEFGIRDGDPYYNETELRLSDKEFRELLFNVYKNRDIDFEK